MEANKLNQFWEDVCNRVKNYDSIDAAQVNAFFRRLTPQAQSDGFLMLTADNDFIKNWIESHYVDAIKQALLDMSGMPYMVLIEVDSTSSNSNNQNNNAASQPASNPVPKPVSSLEERNEPTFEGNNAYSQKNTWSNNQNQEDNWEFYDRMRPESEKDDEEEDIETFDREEFISQLTFENYVIGDSNRMAYQMAVAVAENPGRNSMLNPLFIYGKSGLGKTHLMRAIQNYLYKNHPELRSVYVDSAELISDYTDASLEHDKEKASFKNFKKRYEDADVLLIDDVQYLQGKKQTLDIVFQIFNKLSSAGKQLVLSADRAPKNIDIDERYQSRFNSGGTIDIQPPEIETKLGIVRSFVEEYRESAGIDNFSFDNEIEMYIAENSGSNIRELKSAVTKVIFRMNMFGSEKVSLDDVQQVLDEHFSGSNMKRLTVADIQKEVETFYKVSHADLVGKKRSRNIMYARQMAIFLCRQMLELPYNEIGKKFDRDHSTVMYSVTSVEERIKESREVREELETLKKMIRES